MTEYRLEAQNDAMRRVVSAWMSLGLAALVGAGMFSVLLILARTPALQERIPLVDFFRIALVVHVNLSVLIWLLAIAGALWRLAATRDRPAWDWASLGLAAGGTAVVAISPFAGAGDPLMNNYVPVLRHPLFHAGLILFGLGIASHLLRSLAAVARPPSQLDGPGALRFGIGLGGIVTAVALAALVASWTGMPPAMGGEVYFEYLFWGSGHVLQFTHTLMMMVAWIVLVEAGGMRFELTPRLTLSFLTILALPVLTVPFLYTAHEVTSVGHRLAFTELMKYGGLSCLPIGLAVLVSVIRSRRPAPGAPPETRYLRATLLASMTLFAAGGLLGFLVSGLDIVIPAHYHGSTVGVTIAFMGLTYYLLPRLGFGPLPPRLAWWQPVLYGGGQLLHIIGLAWTGGYGVQRKTAGLAQGVDRAGEIAGMGLMGLGGLISVIGGLLFLVVCYRSLRGRSRPQEPQASAGKLETLED
jgi:hypothetical protein